MDRDSLCPVGAVRGLGIDRPVAAWLPCAHQPAFSVLDVASSESLRGLHYPPAGTGGRELGAARLGCSGAGQVRHSRIAALHGVLANSRSTGAAAGSAARGIN